MPLHAHFCKDYSISFLIIIIIIIIIINMIIIISDELHIHI